MTHTSRTHSTLTRYQIGVASMSHVVRRVSHQQQFLTNAVLWLSVSFRSFIYNLAH
uniref:AlNc14C1017G12718 protein n=1 Tax=Albugo laibachii Nc14 TaxID=890382 RepID=F0X2F3_9STRA|nr:AlNc14C1017G12718 [Albugo laibachii Nc14]|eukprot:CCA28043.1 AlNc14C1017G12718 [Albugo laibachii Nc14]